MDIKLLAVDLDGTMVGHSNIVSSANVEAVKAARAKGVIIVPCTGRLYCESEYVAVMMGGADYMITCNGAVVFDCVNRHHIHMNIMPYSLVDSVLEILDSYNIFYQIYVDDASCCPAKHHAAMHDSPFSKGFLDMFAATQVPLENPRQDVVSQNLDVIKFYVPCFDTDVLQQIKQRVLKLPLLDVAFSFANGMEIFPKGMDKISGLTRLCRQLGIRLEEVMVIGDSENDLEIIKAAGYGVAMGNAPDFVKNAARFVTKSCDDDGVAYAIDKFILGKE